MSVVAKSKRISSFISSLKESAFDARSSVSLAEFFKFLSVYRSYKAVFDESIDVNFSLIFDKKKNDQIIKGSVSLPHGNGRKVSVLALSSSASSADAIAAGAKYAGGEDLINQITEGTIVPVRDFNFCVADQSVMPKLVKSKAVQLLGRAGLMPNIKTGTVGSDVIALVKTCINGLVELRSDKFGGVKCSLGRISFSDEQISENLKSIYLYLKSAKPSSVKGSYIDSVYLSTTMMGSSFRINLSEIYALS